MRGSINCKCGEEVFFDIEAAGPLRPWEVFNIKDLLPEEFRNIPQQVIEEAMKGSLNGYKELRFFENCPKCGGLCIYRLWILMN